MIRTSLALQRNVVMGLLLALAAVAWAVLVRAGGSAGMAGAPTMGLGAPLFLALWVVMMVAMMFPAAMPMILAFHAVEAGKRRSGMAFTATWVFVVGYLLVWTLAGAVAFAGATLGEALVAWAALPTEEAARIGGAVVVAAGLYQLTPLKARCLGRCRTPITFVMTAWRDGAAGALKMGAIHGWWCLGCCWLLFVILFPLGIMNVVAMAAVTALVCAEKTLPWGRLAAAVAAAVLIGLGGAIIADPGLLPTFPMGGGMAVPTPG